MDESMQSLESGKSQPEDMESEFLQGYMHENEVDGMEDNGLESEWNFFVENLLPECSQKDHELQQEKVQDGDPVAELDELLKQLSQMEAASVQEILGHVESDLLQNMLHSIHEQETHTATFHHDSPSDTEQWNIPTQVNTRAVEDREETRSSIRLILQKQEDLEGRQIITRKVVQDDYESMYSFQQCDTQEHSETQQMIEKSKVVNDEDETKGSIRLWELQMQKEFEARQKVALQMFKDCSQTMTWRWARWPPESLRRMSPMTVHIDIGDYLSANLVKDASVILERELSVEDDPVANLVRHAPLILEPERTEIPRGAQSQDLVGLQQQVQQNYQILSQQPLPAEIDANKARYGPRTPTDSNVVTASQNSNPVHCGIRQEEEAPDSPQKCSRTTKAQLAEIPRQIACTLLARTPQDVDSNVIRQLFTQIDKIIIQALRQDMQSGSRENVPHKTESRLLPPLLDSTSILDCTGLKPLRLPIPQRQHAQESGGQERVASQGPPQRSTLQGSHDFPEQESKAPQVPRNDFRMHIRGSNECESLAPPLPPERIRHPRDFITSLRTSAPKSSRQIESKALPSRPDESLYYHQIKAPHLKQVPEPPPKFSNLSLSYSEYRNVGRMNLVHPYTSRNSRQPANVEELFFHDTPPVDELFEETMRNLNVSEVHSNHRPALIHDDNFRDISQGIHTHRPNSGFCREQPPQLRFPDVDSSDLVQLMPNSGFDRQFDELHQMMRFTMFQQVAKRSEQRRSSEIRFEPDSHGFETTFGRQLPQEWRYPQKHYPTHDPPYGQRYYGVHELDPDFADSVSSPSTSDQSESNEFRGLMVEDDPNFEWMTETSEMNSLGYNTVAQIEETNPYYLDSHFDPFRPPVYNFRESPPRSEPESVMWQHFASQNHHEEITHYVDLPTSDYTLRNASRQMAFDPMSQFNVSQLSHREFPQSGEQFGPHHLDVYLDSELQGLELATSSFLRTLRQHAVQNTTPPRNRLRANRQKAFSLHALSDDTSDLWNEDSSDSRETEGLLSEEEDSHSLRNSVGSAPSNEAPNETLPHLQSSPELDNCISMPESSLQWESSNLPQNIPMNGFQETSPLEEGKDHETGQTASKPRRRLPPPQLHVKSNPLPLNSSRATTSKTPPHQTSAQVENPSHRTRVNMCGKIAQRDGEGDLPLPDSSFVHSKDAAQAQSEAVVHQSTDAVESRCANCPSKPPNTAQFHNPSRSVRHTIFGLLVLAGGLYLVENRDQIELQSICAAEATAEAWRWLGGTLLKMSNGEFDN